MAYSESLSNSLSRIGNIANEQVDMPDVSPESLKGVISSGKTLSAIYWGLIVRCDEKMNVWRPALEHIARCIIEGAIIYPDTAAEYTPDKLEEHTFEVAVENNYAIPNDDEAERTNDQMDVVEQRMSRKAYMKKWRGMTDDEVDEELIQIQKEIAMLENTYEPHVPKTNEDDNDEGNEDDVDPNNPNNKQKPGSEEDGTGE
jgi:hypothetical protein